MSEKRRALGRGLGALIPNSPGPGGSSPVDVFFRDNPTATTVTERPDSGTDEADAGRPDANGAPTEGNPQTSEVASTGDGASQNGSSKDAGRADVGTPSDARTSENGATDDHGAGPGKAEGPEDSSAVDGDGGELQPVPGASFAELPLDAIRPNPRQPRTVFDEDEMAELVHSISEIGVLQPIVVRTVTDGEDGVRYELIMGERRWRASRGAGTDTVPAIIKDTTDDDLLRDALLENLHRSELNPLEEAAAYQQLLEDFGCTQEELGTRIGRSRPQISNTLRLLKLPPLVARRVAAGVLSAGHARALLTLPDGAAMERLAQRIVAEGLSVRSVEEIVALGIDDDTAPARRKPRPGTRHPQLDDLAARLADHFDTRAKISLGQKKGRLSIEFASVDDLHRILGQMGVDHTDS